MSTLALFIGLATGNIVYPGSAFNVNAAALDSRAVAEYAGQTKAQSVSEFLMHIIPNTVVDAWKSWARGTAPRSSGAGSPVN